MIKAPNDGLGGKTDEEKMGVTYKQIEELIETGNTDACAKDKILAMFKRSSHKRREIPVYSFERRNYLLDMEEG